MTKVERSRATHLNHVTWTVYLLGSVQTAARRELTRAEAFLGHVNTNGAFPLHGTARYGTVHFWGGFPLGTVPGTFLVPPQPRFQAIRTVTKA